MQKWSFVAVLIAAMAVAAGLYAQDAPELVKPTPAASTKPPPKTAPRPACSVPWIDDVKLARCVKPEQLPVAAAQVPDAHHDQAITVLRSRWEKMELTFPRRQNGSSN